MKDDRAHLQDLEAKLELVDETFEREMRARGFDPAQAENAALPTSLAKLYFERESLREQLDEVRKNTKQ